LACWTRRPPGSRRRRIRNLTRVGSATSPEYGSSGREDLVRIEDDFAIRLEDVRPAVGVAEVLLRDARQRVTLDDHVVVFLGGRHRRRCGCGSCGRRRVDERLQAGGIDVHDALHVARNQDALLVGVLARAATGQVDDAALEGDLQVLDAGIVGEDVFFDLVGRFLVPVE